MYYAFFRLEHHQKFTCWIDNFEFYLLIGNLGYRQLSPRILSFGYYGTDLGLFLTKYFLHYHPELRCIANGIERFSQETQKSVSETSVWTRVDQKALQWYQLCSSPELHSTRSSLKKTQINEFFGKTSYHSTIVSSMYGWMDNHIYLSV